MTYSVKEQSDVLPDQNSIFFLKSSLLRWSPLEKNKVLAQKFAISDETFLY